MEIVGLILLLIGVAFSALGILGLIRFPDVYTRIHASGKVATLGLIFTLFGAAILQPEITFKAIALIIFAVLTSPVASHAIASASHHRYGRLKDNQRDDLADIKEELAKEGKVLR